MTAEQNRSNRSWVLTCPLLGVCMAMSSELLASGGLLLDDASLDGITAGRAEIQVSAHAGAGGNNPVAGTNTAANAVAIESSVSGGTFSGSAGAAGAIACCESSATGVSGTMRIPDPASVAVGSVQTQEVNGLSITIGGIGGVGVAP